MTVTVINRSTQEIVVARSAEAKWVRSTWDLAQRLNPDDMGAPDLVGRAILVDELVSPALDSDKVLGPVGAEPILDLEAGTATWTHTISDKPLALRKIEMIAQIKRLALGPDGIVAQGFVHSVPGGDGPHTYQIEAADQNNMTSIGGLIALGVTDAHGGFWRDINNVHVTMTQEECVAFFAAAAAYKAAVVRRMWALIVAVTNAENHDDLDRIDIAAGTVTTIVEGEPVVSDAWPENGS